MSGLLLWDDWRTIKLWVSYTGIHVLIVLGIYDLSSAGSDLFELANQARASFSDGHMRGRIRDVGKMSSIARALRIGAGSGSGRKEERTPGSPPSML